MVDVSWLISNIRTLVLCACEGVSWLRRSPRKSAT